MSDHDIELEIQAKGLTAPRVTPADIEANIVQERYFTAAQGVAGATYVIHNPNEHGSLSLLTFCVLVLKNGFTVTGLSACASPENFDAELGRKIAREKAVDQLWPLMGYALKEKLYTQSRGDENHDIGWAIRQAKLGKRIARAGWNGKGLSVMFCALAGTDVLPHLRLYYSDGSCVPWAPSVTDTLLQDWEVVP